RRSIRWRNLPNPPPDRPSLLKAPSRGPPNNKSHSIDDYFGGSGALVRFSISWRSPPSSSSEPVGAGDGVGGAAGSGTGADIATGVGGIEGTSAGGVTTGAGAGGAIGAIGRDCSS